MLYNRWFAPDFDPKDPKLGNIMTSNTIVNIINEFSTIEHPQKHTQRILEYK